MLRAEHTRAIEPARARAAETLKLERPRFSILDPLSYLATAQARRTRHRYSYD